MRLSRKREKGGRENERSRDEGSDLKSACGIRYLDSGDWEGEYKPRWRDGSRAFRKFREAQGDLGGKHPKIGRRRRRSGRK